MDTTCDIIPFLPAHATDKNAPRSNVFIFSDAIRDKVRLLLPKKKESPENPPKAESGPSLAMVGGLNAVGKGASPYISLTRADVMVNASITLSTLMVIVGELSLTLAMAGETELSAQLNEINLAGVKLASAIAATTPSPPQPEPPRPAA